MDRLQFFGPLDLAALAVLAIAYLGTGWLIENASAARPSVSVLMADYRREWMRQFVTRQPRIFDATILGNLRQGTTFFASGCMIAIGAGLALVGNTERLLGLAQDLSLENAPSVVWEVKLLVILLFVANAFLKFVWSHRLFGYCSVIMAAVPNEPDDPVALPRAAQAGEINITAARSFNRGLRSLYFALGTLAWLLGPVPLVFSTLGTVLVLWRREFSSDSRAVLMGQPD